MTTAIIFDAGGRRGRLIDWEAYAGMCDCPLVDGQPCTSDILICGYEETERLIRVLSGREPSLDERYSKYSTHI